MRAREAERTGCEAAKRMSALPSETREAATEVSNGVTGKEEPKREEVGGAVRLH